MIRVNGYRQFPFGYSPRAVNAYTWPAAAGEPAAGRDDHGRGSAAVNPAFTAASGFS